MRHHLLTGFQKKTVFEAALETLKTQRFHALHADLSQGCIDAMLHGSLVQQKHLHLQLSELKGEQQLRVEVRNLGLELRRSRQNELMEARFVRALEKALENQSKKRSAA